MSIKYIVALYTEYLDYHVVNHFSLFVGKEMSGNGKSKEDSCESARYQPLPYEETNLIQVVRAVDYEEPVPSLKTKDNAQSNFYSEVGMVMSTNNSEMIIQQPVVNNYVSSYEVPPSLCYI